MKLVLFLPLLLWSGFASASEDAPRHRRVVGGTEVDASGKWPWLVSLLWKYPKDLTANPPQYRYGTCGASIINEQWLLSASHCFDQIRDQPQHWTARMATLKFKPSPLDKFKDIVGKATNHSKWMLWEIGIEKIIKHPDFQPGMKARWQNDIALVKLNQKIPIGGVFQFWKLGTVALPKAGDASFPVRRQECMFAGWGCEKAGGPPTKKQHEVMLPIAKEDHCRRLFDVDTETRLCAGRLNFGIGTCMGDSGGPLVCKRDGRWVQVGVSSFNNSREPGQNFAVFTRVSYFMDWIKKTLAEN